MTTFSIPETLPQDLLLIKEFIDQHNASEQSRRTLEDANDDIASSGSDIDSEEEIEKDLTVILDGENEDDRKSLHHSDPSSDTDSSSETDSESEPGPDDGREGKSAKVAPLTVEPDDEDDPFPNIETHPHTKNEIVDMELNIPDLQEVGADEDLEKIGEVMSIVNNAVIVRGLASGHSSRGSERALDCDTLLVFEDRKVLGYIYETFGPTLQPFYQVKFNQKYPLDPEKVTIGRQVFHAPRRSHFVFVNQLRQSKGSDASNVHDEEPAEDELEFSDDEAEIAHRSHLKKKRAGSCTRSAASSRHTTPVPSQMHDQDMMNESILNGSAYDEYGPYDLDYGANPSRPAPEPYDDPYSDAYNMTKSDVIPQSSTRTNKVHEKPINYRDQSSPYPGGRGRGRSRGRGRRVGTNASGGSGRDIGYHPRMFDPSAGGYDPRMPHASLPLPYPQGQGNLSSNFVPPTSNTHAFPAWGYPNEQLGRPQSYQSQMLPSPNTQNPMLFQPHINPRFASAFGLRPTPNTPASPQVPSQPTGAPPDTPLHNWTEQWTVPVTNHTDLENTKPNPQKHC